MDFFKNLFQIFLLMTTVSFSAPGHGLQTLREFDKLPYLRSNVLSLQQTSHDPTGLNGDGGHFRSVINGENVMADLIGPGVVYHIWLTGFQANERIKFYFDGESTPRINETIANFFSGTKVPFLSPLCLNDLTSSGGFVCYLPFPYAISLRITTNSFGLYQVSYHQLDPTASVTSWTGSESATDVLNMYRNKGVDPKNVTSYASTSFNADINRGSTTTLINLTNGPRTIGQLLLKIPDIIFITPRQNVTDDGRAHVVPANSLLNWMRHNRSPNWSVGSITA